MKSPRVGSTYNSFFRKMKKCFLDDRMSVGYIRGYPTPVQVPVKRSFPFFCILKMYSIGVPYLTLAFRGIGLGMDMIFFFFFFSTKYLLQTTWVGNGWLAFGFSAPRYLFNYVYSDSVHPLLLSLLFLPMIDSLPTACSIWVYTYTHIYMCFTTCIGCGTCTRVSYSKGGLFSSRLRVHQRSRERPLLSDGRQTGGSG